MIDNICLKIPILIHIHFMAHIQSPPFPTLPLLLCPLLFTLFKTGNALPLLWINYFSFLSPN